jgi:Flp pilus assembly protein TadG
MKSTTPPRRGGEDGGAAVEASLITGVLLLMILSSVELGRALWTYNTMLLAVEEAGRYAMTYRHGRPIPCTGQRQAQHCPKLSDTPLANCSASRARQVLSAYHGADVEVSVNEDTTSVPAKVTICASYSLGFTTPKLLPAGTLELISRVTVPLS